MTTLVDRITAVQEAHERTGPPLRCVCGGRAEYRCVCHHWEECECGVVTPYGDHPAHVAERVAAELNLTEESVPLMPPHPGKYTRLVSGWAAVEDQLGAAQ